jgi:hypothetical protein
VGPIGSRACHTWSTDEVGALASMLPGGLVPFGGLDPLVGGDTNEGNRPTGERGPPISAGVASLRPSLQKLPLPA